MNRNLYQEKENSMLSRTFLFGKLQRVIVGLALVASISSTAIAQYPGGGGGTGTYPGGYTSELRVKRSSNRRSRSWCSCWCGLALLETSQSSQAARLRGWWRRQAC